MNDTSMQANPWRDTPDAEGPGMLASRYFWVGGLLSGELWLTLALWAIELC